MMTNTNLPVSSVSPSGGFLTSVLLSLECRSDAVRTTLEESVPMVLRVERAPTSSLLSPLPLTMIPPPPLLSRGSSIHVCSHVSMVARLSAVSVSLACLRLALLSSLSSVRAWLIVSSCAFLAVLQLTADRASSTMRAKLYRLDGTAEPIERIACASVLTVEFLDRACVFPCAFIHFPL